MTEMPQWQLAGLASQAGQLLGLTLDLTWPGPGVRIGTEGDGFYLRTPSGTPGRISITGWFPVTSYGYRPGDRKAITVRADRGPAAIAAEITSRMLPAYREAVTRARAHDAAEKAAKQARDTLAAYITGLFPAKATAMPSHSQTDYRSEILLYLPGSQGGYIKFHGDGSQVELERFKIPAAVALRMLETAALLIPANHQESPA